MSINQDDIQDIKLARSVAVVDLWDIDDRINRLENCIERSERIVQILIEHAHDERVKDFERILKEELEKIKNP